MAKQVWNKPIDKHTDWGGDASTDNLPVSGEMVQKFIKESLEGKAGVFWYDTANNRYLVFADAEERDNYIADPTQTQLIIGTFDAPFNYTAEITLASAAYNAVFLNSTGNYIEFSFDIKNKQGASTGENVNVTYTFIRNATKVIVTEARKHGEMVRFNIDKYLGEGTNTIVIGITGQTSLAATTASVTYQVVNLQLTDEMDISKVYTLSNGAQTMEIPFTVSGYGTKIVEWYIDGELLPFVKNEDDVVDVIASRTKYITLSNLQQGRHSLQIRAYTIINGEEFYTDTLYRDLMVYTGAGADVIMAVAVTIPHAYGVLSPSDPVTIYGMVQYIPYNLRFATYSPSNASSTEVSIALNGEVKGVVGSANGNENIFSLMSTSEGSKTLTLTANGMTYTIPVVVDKTTMDLQDITEGLTLDFGAIGKSNNSTDRDEWSFGDYTGTFEGFNWNSTSGWVDGRLEINDGASFSIDYAPLSNYPTDKGKTIEIEWMTKNVSNDDAVICDLRGDNGVGILITATKVSMRSADGVVVETEYKSDENVRVGFVINRSNNATNQRLSFIYANGIVSRGEKWAANDDYTSDRQIRFTASSEAEISLKSIRIYDAALTSDQMLNNYILYRDTISEMMDVYDRNDVYEQGTTTFSPDKMMGRLPVMIVTGDIPVLENTSDKDTQIVVDIDYTDMQNPSRSFRMEGAAMRPQGTSSMGYPKKNFRIYTQKVDGTVLYDANGNVVEDKLYSFKDNAQPVDCWCLKADYAESSGTHNTGIARLWNEALMNVQIEGEYVCRTGAQKAALAAGYPYDVRTTIDGFPILLFYRPTKNDDVIFIGKYNFNNDKSTESVFGFTGIPGFDNTSMQCWEVLNNGNALALFTTTEGFDTGWSEAFESRYPDTKTPYTGDLKAFCKWMVNVSQKDFATQKWQHLNVYMMAAYWVYLMRHAAADQFVKNAMFTSEDGQKWYYILYDNDTINGLINTGRLRIKPTDDRQTVDETGSYVFAGHDSRLWNMLEADEEFKSIVSAIDNALYSAGISYANTIKIFDEEQADKWVEKVYNQDAQYKYVGPYVEKGIDNLFMLQGKRDLHRKWWLAKRFSIYDAKYVSGTYKSQAVELKCLNGTAAGQSFKVTAGFPLDYGYGINNVPREFGIALDTGESYTFTTKEVVNLGDPIRIYGAPNIAELDLSPMASRLAVVTIANVYEESLGTKLTKLVLGKSGVSNLEVTEISGLKQAVALEHLDIRGFKNLTSLDLSSHTKLKTLIATASGATSFIFAKGAPVEHIALPAGVRTLELTQLPYLHADGVTFEALASLETMNVTSCPNVSNDFGFVYDWYTSKTIADERTSLAMDNVDWQNVDVEKFIEIAQIGRLSLKGRVYLNSINLEQMNILMDKFGESAFNEDAEFFIDGPANAFVLGKTELLEGTSETYRVVSFGGKAKSVQFSLYNGSNSYTSVTQEGVLTVREGFGNGTFTMRVIVTTEEDVFYTDVNISVVKRVYPTASNIKIEGSGSIENDYHTYSLSYPDDVNGEFDTAWTLDVPEEGFVEIESYDDFSCTLKRVSETYVPIYLTLTATLTKKVNGAAVATVSKEIAYINDDIAEYDAGIIAALYAAGLCSSDKYITKDEAAKVTASDLQSGTSANTSIFYLYRRQIKNFDGFQFFTGVTEVPAYCFSDSTIESIVLHDRVTRIGDCAFYIAYSLKSIYISKNLISIGDRALSATAITSIELPEGLSSIDGGTFWSCNYLEEIVVPSTVSEIPTNFCTSSGVKRVVLKNGVQKINSNAFLECLYLESLTIPSTVTTISDIFNQCDKVQFNVAENNPNFKSIDGVLYDKDLTKLLLFRKGAITKEHTIPSSVNHIGDYGFYRTTVEVVNHGGGLHLGSSAFTECPSLRRVNAKVLSFSASPAVNYSSLLESITLAESVTTLPQYCFIGCTSLKTMRFESTTAPKLNYSVFGISSNNYVGRNTYNTGENFLYLPLNAIGYETSDWLSTLQNPNACGFSIYGKLTINSNRENAQFSVTYNTVSGTTKSVIVGVGTCYLNDVQYNTSMTIVPITTGVGEFDWSTKTFVYSKDNNVVENNAYFFPTNATIVGDTNPVKNGTYTWSTTISDVDGAYTAEWSLSGEITSQVEIASQDNTTCVLRVTGLPTEFYYGTLALTLRKTDGTLLASATKSLAAVIEDVIVTSKSNEALQGALYKYGLVANETYSLKSEIEKITAGKLFYGNNDKYNIFYDYYYNRQGKRLLSFDEFEYFTGVTSLPDFALFSLDISSVKLPNTIKSIGRQAVSNIKIKSLIIPESVTSFSRTAVAVNNSNLKQITSYAKATTIPQQCFYDNYALESINIPASVASIELNAYSVCPKLREIICSRQTAPTCASYVFGNSGVNAVSPKYLRVPSGAIGYEEGVWQSELLANGFYIYGRVRLYSNKENAKFNISYTTTEGTIKTVYVGVGSTYLNDIKYDTQMTITPDAISGHTWSEASKTFVYNDSSQEHAFDAYIYPTAMTIDGTGSLVGGKSATYTAMLTPSNFDVPVTYAWSVSGSANVSITPNGSTCEVSSNSVETEENFTLSCVVKTGDKTLFQSSRQISLVTRPNYITAVYDVNSTTNETKLFYDYFKVEDILYLEIDGVQVEPVTKYIFQTTGSHTIKCTLSNLDRAFNSTRVISIDLSECDDSIYTSLYYSFAAGLLTSIEWGETTFPNVSSLFYTFSNIGVTHLSISHLAATIFKDNVCSSAKSQSIVLPSNVTDLGRYVCNYCYSLQQITIPSKVTNIGTYGFRGCENLREIVCLSKVAPSVGASCFSNTGSSVEAGQKILYVPADSTGYNEGLWLELQTQNGFTLSATL